MGVNHHPCLFIVFSGGVRKSITQSVWERMPVFLSMYIHGYAVSLLYLL